MSMMRVRRGLARLLGLAVLLVAIHYSLAAAVLAHADYERSVPAADEVVSQAPQQVQVWFTQDLFRREAMNSLEVYGPDEQRVDLDDAAIDDDDRKLMTVSLQSDLADGVYTVRWRSLSADDGDDADGEFQFTVRAAEPSAEAEQPAPTSVAATPTAAPEDDQPTPANTPQSEQTEPESTPAAADEASESRETPSDRADPGMGLPCMGSTLPVLLFLGALLIGRRKKR